MLDVLDAALNVASGGLFGLVGAGFSKFMGWQEKKLDLSHEITMVAEQRKTIEMEMMLAREKGALDLEVAHVETDAANLQAALQASTVSNGSSQWVRDLRESLRPILTYTLIIGTFALLSLMPANKWIGEIMFLTTLAVTFWFGSRPVSRK